MSDSEKSNNYSVESVGWEPGERLKEARLQSGKSLEGIAEETLIPISKLEALENGEYRKVGKDVFVIAYIRKYAKSLEVESDPFVEQFKARVGYSSVCGTSDNGVNTGLVSKNSDFSLLDKISAWQIVLIVVVGWLLSIVLFDSDEPETLAPVVQESVLEEQGEISEQFEQKPSPDGEYSQVEDPEKPVLLSQEPEIEALPPVDLSTETTESADILVMSFVDECWVEIKDAKGEVIFAQERNSGDNLRLSGEAPFTMMLGNARAVDVVVNGRRVSTEPSPGNRTMRISVGP